MVFNYPSGDTAVYDPRVPDGLMGHDYHGVLINEAKYLFSEKYGSLKAELSNFYADSLIRVYAAKNLRPDDNWLKTRSDLFAQEDILTEHADEFIDNIENWKQKARTVLSVQKIAHTQQGTISHYGLIPRPVDKRENYIKRCVALPGDEIEIINSILFVNGKKAWKAPNQNLEYEIVGGPLLESTVKSIGLSEEEGDYYRDLDGNVSTIFLTKSRKTELEKMTSNVVFKLSLVPQYSDNKATKPKGIDLIRNLDNFPKDLYINNTVSDFAKFRIPKKGAVVKLTKDNIAWYRRAITAYEGHKLLEKTDGIYIDGKKATTYKFAMNYYWLMGDNRYNSADSRVWGYVPEDHVVGKASIVWFSKSAFTGIRWDRMFTKIR